MPRSHPFTPSFRGLITTLPDLRLVGSVFFIQLSVQHLVMHRKPEKAFCVINNHNYKNIFALYYKDSISSSELLSSLDLEDFDEMDRLMKSMCREVSGLTGQSEDKIFIYLTSLHALSDFFWSKIKSKK
jgi:hypothetical protein